MELVLSVSAPLAMGFVIRYPFIGIFSIQIKFHKAFLGDERNYMCTAMIRSMWNHQRCLTDYSATVPTMF